MEKIKVAPIKGDRYTDGAKICDGCGIMAAGVDYQWVREYGKCRRCMMEGY